MRSAQQDHLHLEAHRILSGIEAEAQTFGDINQRAAFFKDIALSVVVASMHGDTNKLPEMFNTPVFRTLVLTPVLRYAEGDKVRLEAMLFRLGQFLTVREYTERQLALEAKHSRPFKIAA